MIRSGTPLFALLAAIGLVLMAKWTTVRLLDRCRERRRVRLSHLLVLGLCGLAILLGLCLFFLVWATLGPAVRSPRDALLPCLLALLGVFVGPTLLLAWLAARPRRGSRR